jgi:hypothetical protein
MKNIILFYFRKIRAKVKLNIIYFILEEIGMYSLYLLQTTIKIVIVIHNIGNDNLDNNYGILFTFNVSVILHKGFTQHFFFFFLI